MEDNCDSALEFRFEAFACSTSHQANALHASSVTSSINAKTEDSDLRAKVKADIESHLSSCRALNDKNKTRQDPERMQLLAKPKRGCTAVEKVEAYLVARTKWLTTREEQEQRLENERGRQRRMHVSLERYKREKEEQRVKEAEKVRQEEGKRKIYQLELNKYLEKKAAETLKDLAERKKADV